MGKKLKTWYQVTKWYMCRKQFCQKIHAGIFRLFEILFINFPKISTECFRISVNIIPPVPKTLHCASVVKNR